MKLTPTKEGTVIEIYVKPNSPEFRVTVEDDKIVVHCTQKPERGKANKEIRRELTRLFLATVEIVSGNLSKQKRLLIIGVNREDAEKLLKSIAFR